VTYRLNGGEQLALFTPEPVERRPAPELAAPRRTRKKRRTAPVQPTLPEPPAQTPEMEITR